MAIRAKFTGKRNEDGTPREYLDGVPSRDIDEDEWKALSNEQRATVRGSSLYATRTDADMHGGGSSSAESEPETVDLVADVPDSESGGGE